jgi:hypothetical protein
LALFSLFVIGFLIVQKNMKYRLLIAVVFTAMISAQAQTTNPGTSQKQWNISSDVNFYIFKDDFFVLPVIRADKNKLHLEARYNYEDIETFSAWIGYNVSGGGQFEYTFTPMVGGVVGLSNGIAPGLEVTLTYKKFEFYSEMEYLFDWNETENNFYYNWADILYSPNDWLWFGISGQRTRLYQTNLEIQRGLTVGAGWKVWELNTYAYNFGFDDPFFVITLSAEF